MMNKTKANIRRSLISPKFSIKVENVGYVVPVVDGNSEHVAHT